MISSLFVYTLLFLLFGTTLFFLCWTAKRCWNGDFNQLFKENDKVTWVFVAIQMFTAFVFFITVLTFIMEKNEQGNKEEGAAAVGLICLAVMTLYPLVKFNPTYRLVSGIKAWKTRREKRMSIPKAVVRRKES